MSTKQYKFELQKLNKDLEKFSSMLYDTEVRYYDFETYQKEEEYELATFNDDTEEAVGNGLSDEVMAEAMAAEAEWKEKEQLSMAKPSSSQENAPLAWTKRRTGNYSKTIFINETFIKRIQHANIESKSFEWCVIVVAQAFSIIHETGHLSLRWKGILHSPSTTKNPEAGNYLELRFFEFMFSLLVDRDSNTPWDYSQEIKGY